MSPRALLAGLLIAASGFAVPAAQGPPPKAAAETRDAVTPQQLEAAIGQLGTVDFAVRMAAARTVRRAAAPIAVPALLQAAAGHADGYVRFRALVLLAGFKDPRAREAMATSLTERNDRLRTVAYTYFEHNLDPAVLPRLLDALTREESEFVRPALTRAIAAYGSDPRVQERVIGLVMKGQDFFRSVVIEAAGDYKAAYALPALTAVAKLEGPLQDDAVLAMGKIGDKRALETFVALQRTAPRSLQPTVAAAICLLGVNCASHQGYLTKSLAFAISTAGYQELLRASAAGLAALGVAGNKEAVATLIEQGAPTRDPARAAVALALGTVALRNTAVLLDVLQDPALVAPATELLREAFDMLEEDFEEERFFVAVRAAYWQAAEGSPARKTAQALIQGLEF
jgi:HEAT repeat protein